MSILLCRSRATSNHGSATGGNGCWTPSRKLAANLYGCNRTHAINPAFTLHFFLPALAWVPFTAGLLACESVCYTSDKGHRISDAGRAAQGNHPR